MRRKTFVLVTVLLLAVLILPGASAARPPDRPYAGTWWSIDVDGSYQQMTIAGGARGKPYNVVYKDWGASVCGKVDEVPVYWGKAKGQGIVSTDATGEYLAIALDGWCQPSSGADPWTATSSARYDAAADTLTDDWVTWHRLGATAP